MTINSSTISAVTLKATNQAILATTVKNGLPPYKLQQVIDYMNQHLHQEIQLANLAKVANISPFYFCHSFKQSTGTSPYQYLIQRRVERAKQLLQHGEMTIAEIALECGFSNQSHFTKRFQQWTGLTPRVYRNQQKLIPDSCDTTSLTTSKA
jgi:AraC family transcriptional regulator